MHLREVPKSHMLAQMIPCVDPGIFVRGGPGQIARKQP